MKPIEELLAGHRFFKDLPQPMIAALSERGKFRQERAGRFVVHEGDPSCLLVILHGRLRIETHGPGRPGAMLETLVAGDVYGSSWVLAPHGSVFDVQAVEDTDLVAFDGEALRQLVDADAPLGNALLKRLVRALTEKLRAARLQLTDVYRHPAQ